MTGSRPEALGFPRLFEIHDHRDAEGRAIGEHRASNAVLEAIPMVLKQCPYPDSRFQHEHRMNVSALRQLTSHWDDILAGVSLIRQQYLTRRGLPSVEQTKDCWAIGEAVACIPSYIIHRTERTVRDGAIDPLVGGLYKVIIGVNSVYSVLVSGEVMTGRTEPILSSDDVATIADLGGFLIGAEQVCAGSLKQISQAIEAVVHGAPLPATSSSALRELLDPLDNFFSFADGMRRLAAGKRLCEIAATFALLNLAACLETETATASMLRSTIDALLTRLDSPGTIRKFATRAPEQRERLVQGWFELAGGSSRIQRSDDRGAPAWAAECSRTLGNRVHSHALCVALSEQLNTLLELEQSLLPVIEQTEQQINAALGRSSPEPSRDARRVLRGFGVTVLDQLSSQLAVDLDAISAAVASLQSGEGAHVIVK